MKKKLTVTVDEKLIPRAKLYARRRGVSVSSLIEDALRRLTDGGGPGFVERWRGAFEAVEEGDERYRALAEKYL
jgi:hypothetical protein